MDWKKFLPNEHNKRLFPGFVAFCIAFIGVMLGFVASHLKIETLFVAAIVITFIGIFGGFVFIAHGWYVGLKAVLKGKQE